MKSLSEESSKRSTFSPLSYNPLFISIALQRNCRRSISIWFKCQYLKLLTRPKPCQFQRHLKLPCPAAVFGVEMHLYFKSPTFARNPATDWQSTLFVFFLGLSKNWPQDCTMFFCSLHPASNSVLNPECCYTAGDSILWPWPSGVSESDKVPIYCTTRPRLHYIFL